MVCEKAPYCCQKEWGPECAELCKMTGACGGCKPQCAGKVCGPDGCGGTCGACPPNGTCSGAGQCVPNQVCGDGKCDAGVGEDCTSCPLDCSGCTATCGDGKCDKFGGEDCKACPKDCGPCLPVCGDGQCQSPETCTTCAKDCGSCPNACGDGKCQSELGENCKSCAKDCGTCDTTGCIATGQPGCNGCACGKKVCAVAPWCCDKGWTPECVDMCMKYSCEGKQCGSGACGVQCGACPPYQKCTDTGLCIGGGGCGNGICGDVDGEWCASCPQDCGPCPDTCGDGKCSPNEGCKICP
jgi:hypothetical protein